MQLILTPATGGQPVVLGLGSATQQGALNLAEIVGTPEANDLILMARSGVLNGTTFANFAAAIGTQAASTVELTVPTPGGYGTDPGGLSSTLPLIDLVQSGSNRLYASFQNSPTENCGIPGGATRTTVGIFASIEHYDRALALGQIAAGAPYTIDPALIFQAAVNWCSAENNNPARAAAPKVQIIFHEAGYFPGWSQLVLPDAGEVYTNSITGDVMPWFECPNDTKSIHYAYGLQDGLIINQTQQANGILCHDVRLQGFGLCKPFTYGVNWYSGLFTTDLTDPFTASAGNWAGLRPQFTWQVSSNPTAVAAMVAGGNTVYFDTLPNGWTLAQIQALVAANVEYGVGGFNLQYLGLGCTIASVTASTLAGYTGYQVVFAPPANPDAQYSGAPIQNSIPLPKTAQLDTPAQPASMGNPATPELIAEPAIPSTSIIFYTGQSTCLLNGEPASGPYYARGMCMWLVVDNLQLINIKTMGFSQGQSVINGMGKNYYNFHPQSFCNDLRQDTGAERFQGGTGVTISPRYSTGDQCLQPQTNIKFSPTGGFTPWADMDLTWDIYDPDCFCPNAAPLALASNIANQQQGFTVVASGPVAAGTSTAPFANGVFAGLIATTGANSLASAAVAGFAYVNSGYLAANKAVLYCGCIAGIIPGSFVIGYQDSGGSVGNVTSGTCNGVGPYLLTFALPYGSTAAGVWRRAVALPKVQFAVGIPVGALISVNRTRVFGGRFRSGAITSCVTLHNADGQMVNECELWGTVIDGWWQTGKSAVGININGGGYGGNSLRCYGIKIFNPGMAAFASEGVQPDVVFDAGCLFGVPQNGRIPGYAFTPQPNVAVCGAQNARIAGVVQAAPGSSALQIGTPDGSLALGEPSPNGSHNTICQNLRLDYCQDGQFALIIQNSNNVLLLGVDMNQATALGAGSAMGILLSGNTGSSPTQAPQNARLMSVNMSNMDGEMLSAGSGATYVTGPDLVAGSAGLPALVTPASMPNSPENGPNSWTPGFTFATPGDALVVTPIGTPIGTWSQLGTRVRVKFSISFTLTFDGTTSGVAQIGPLPVKSVSDGLTQALDVTLPTSGVTFPNSGTALVLMVPSASFYIEVLGMKSGAGNNETAATAPSFTSGGTYTISGSGEYDAI